MESRRLIFETLFAKVLKRPVSAPAVADAANTQQGDSTVTRRLYRWMLLVLLAGLPAVSIAQPPHVHFHRFEVAIWPEYDQPAALVMYRAWLAPDVQLPITVTLPLPAEVSSPSAVAKRGPGTGLLVAPHTIESNGDWKLVHLQTDLPEIRVEFYMDLATDQPARSFTFEWPGGPVIDEAFYEVMQPLGATDFAATPSSEPPALGQDGLVYQREELGPIAEGATFFVQFAYEKSTPDLTASALTFCTFIELSKVRDETHSTIFLWSDECWCCPFTVICFS